MCFERSPGSFSRAAMNMPERHASWTVDCDRNAGSSSGNVQVPSVRRELSMEAKMQARLQLCLALLLFSAVISNAQPSDVIKVVAAAYGGQGRIVDVSRDMQSLCDGKTRCDYYIDGLLPQFVEYMQHSGLEFKFEKTLGVSYLCGLTEKSTHNVDFHHLIMSCP
jgi:hypothetical protein